MARSTFALVLLSSMALGAAPAPATAPNASLEPSTRQFLESAPLLGSEADAIVETSPIQGTDNDAIFRPEVRDGGDDMARYEAPIPPGGVELAPGDVVAPQDEQPGLMAIESAEGAVPGGLEPGVYDGTKDTDATIWALQTFLNEGGQKYRFLGDRVFKAEVKVVKHQQVRWVWGRQEMDDVIHTRKYRRVKVGTEIKSLRIGAEVIRKSAGYRMGVLKQSPIDAGMNEDAGGTAVLEIPVRRRVYAQVVCPVYQSYRVPVYRWEPVSVRTTERQATLSWIKRYRDAVGTFTVWAYLGGFDEWTQKNPTLLGQATAARAVTKRVLDERATLLQGVTKPPLESYLRTAKPTDDPMAEFVLEKKRKSVRPGVTEFVEDNVPDAELVSITVAKAQ